MLLTLNRVPWAFSEKPLFLYQARDKKIAVSRLCRYIYSFVPCTTHFLRRRFYIHRTGSPAHRSPFKLAAKSSYVNHSSRWPFPGFSHALRKLSNVLGVQRLNPTKEIYCIISNFKIVDISAIDKQVRCGETIITRWTAQRIRRTRSSRHWVGCGLSDLCLEP